ncbi:radial spoke head 10 homolog B isoform X2 [Halichoeres trimaculatus]|uniref:radial spoke head 10 homolog B isoform X2 n=1 Tax=Halichoeres trimaculatus TaxID=147232 RepID=UPI003D9F1F96
MRTNTAAKGGEETKPERCSGVSRVNLTDIKQHEKEAIHEFPSNILLVPQRYEGDMIEGQFHGVGLACFEGGHVYKGMFSKGLMDGRGVFTLAGGFKYEGEFVCNQPMGEGTFIWPDGSTYNGQVYKGLRHGTGTFTFATTCVSYTGQWDQGAKHGKGEIFYNKDKTSWYKGYWVKNSREGWGVRGYPSGNTYSGEWKNNQRHGKGTMRWLALGEEYSGMWQNGVQHGRGTHTWILRRADGSQYIKNNQYTGDFLRGQRHGQGTFYYAGGAVYEGEWRKDKKHGKGKFTFKDGRVFEGDFVNDQMMTDILSGQREPTPFCGPSPLPGSDLSVLGPDMALNIDHLLDQIPERNRDTEREQVEFVVLRLATELRSVYSFYSRLGQAHSPDNTFLLSRLQLWRLLKDCYIHHHNITLIQIDNLIRDAPTADQHFPFVSILLRGLLSCLVVVSYHIYHKDIMTQKNLLASCFSKLMTDNILPNAKNVKGFLFRHPDCAVVAMSYSKRCWEIYQEYCKVFRTTQDEPTLTCRHLLWIFKDLHLLDTNLTVQKLLQLITSETRDPENYSSCLDLEITLLEFFEVLLGAAEVKCQQVCGGLEEGGFKTEDRKDEVDASAQDVKGNQAFTEEHGGRTKVDAKDHDPELLIQMIHQFFNHFFFPAYEHYQLVSKKVTEEQLHKEAWTHEAQATG